jgi:hypothetical protein
MTQLRPQGIQMDDLIEKLGRATGPDRELDLAIINFKADLPWKWMHVWSDTIVQEKYGPVGPKTPGNPICSLERFTESMDDAMTLMPKGAGIRLERYWLRDREAWTAVASTGGIPSNPARQFVAEDAYTPALALCIAALKARAEMTESSAA